MDALAGSAVVGACRYRYSKNQTAMLTPLTSVNIPHHRATGFDQAKDLERAGKFKLIDHSTCNGADILPWYFCHNQKPGQKKRAALGTSRACRSRAVALLWDLMKGTAVAAHGALGRVHRRLHLLDHHDKFSSSRICITVRGSFRAAAG